MIALVALIEAVEAFVLLPSLPAAGATRSLLAGTASPSRWRWAAPSWTTPRRPLTPRAAGRLRMASGEAGTDPFAAATQRAQRINYAFIAACVPGILPYQEAVDMFVATTIGCLAEGVSIGALDLTLSQTQSTGNADLDRALGFGSAGRTFQAEEVGLRRQWILFVYAAALAIGSHEPQFSSPGDLSTLRYVRNLYENFYAKGQRDLSSIKLEMTFAVAGCAPCIGSLRPALAEKETGQHGPGRGRRVEREGRERSKREREREEFMDKREVFLQNRGALGENPRLSGLQRFLTQSRKGHGPGANLELSTEDTHPSTGSDRDSLGKILQTGGGPGRRPQAQAPHRLVDSIGTNICRAGAHVLCSLELLSFSNYGSEAHTSFFWQKSSVELITSGS